MIKNTDSKLYQALDRVATPRRVLLTGTPLQNNLLEYFHMVSFVKKGELGDQSKFCRLYKEKISNDRDDDDDDREKKKQALKKRVWALTKKLDKIVQRRGPY